MHRLSIRSILVGGLIDVFVSSLLGAVSVVFVLLLLSVAHTNPDSTPAVTDGIVHGNPIFIGAQVVIGALCSFLGGYIAARLARHDEKLNGAVSSVLSVASGLIAIAMGHNPDQLVIQIVSLPLKPLFGFAGGAYRLAQVRAKRAPAR